MDHAALLTDEARALAAEQAEKDAALWAALQARDPQEARIFEADDLPPIEEATPSEALRPLNRRERRQMVAEFKRNLSMLPRAMPATNPTIIPKSKRRKRKS